MPKVSKAQKPVSVLVTSALVTGASKETNITQVTQKRKEMILDRFSCIHYPVQFEKDKRVTIWSIIDSSSEINAITPAYAKQLGLWI